MLLRLECIGHAGKDADMSYTPAGKAVTRFSLATSRKWTERESGEKREETTWINVTAFDHLAEIASQYVHKGSKVFIAGRPTARAWMGKQGDAQASLDVVITDLVLLDPKGAGADASASEHTHETAASGPKVIGPGETANADDLPF